MQQFDELLAALYGASPATVDEMPYSSEFEELYARALEEGLPISDRHELWRRRANLRKRGLLARKRRGG